MTTSGLGPYELDTIVVGDCLDVMMQLPDMCIDAVITDPPYGKVAGWNKPFPTSWYAPAMRIASMVAIITGSCGLKQSLPLVGDDFLDVIAARIRNGRTRGPLGFDHWLAVVVAGRKPRHQTTNFFDFIVSGEKPDHPTPKALSFMLKLVEKLTERGETIFDPFMGSGTTAVAAKMLGRRFLGCDISKKYVDVANNRLVRIDGVQLPLI